MVDTTTITTIHITSHITAIVFEVICFSYGIGGTVARPGPGLILACTASVLLVVGLYFHRRAYKPLHDALEGRFGE